MATFSAKVVGGRLNLRASCSTSASSLIQIPDKTAINVETVSGHNDWFKTSYGGYTGYVVAKYVQITANEVHAPLRTHILLGKLHQRAAHHLSVLPQIKR